MSDTSATLPYYKAYPRDFIEGTAGMSFELKGAYRLVLDLIYMQSGSLPDDDRYISGLLGLSVRKWRKLRQQLIDIGKITAERGIISNKRADKELIISRKYQEKQSENRSHTNKNNDLQSPRCYQPEPEPDIKEREDKSSLKKKPRKTSIPEDAVISDHFMEIARKEGISPVEAEAQFLRFRDRAVSKGETYANWEAAWRNWLRSPYFRPITNVTPIRRGQDHERIEQLYAEAGAMLARNPF